MSTTALDYEIVSPEALLAASSAEAIAVPGTEGDFEVLSGHAPFMSTMRPGVVHIKGDDEQRIFVKGGLAQVAPGGLTILAEESIDLASADKGAYAQQLADTREDLGLAKDDQERDRLQSEINWLEALVAAL